MKLHYFLLVLVLAWPRASCTMDIEVDPEQPFINGRGDTNGVLYLLSTDAVWYKTDMYESISTIQLQEKGSNLSSSNPFELFQESSGDHPQLIPALNRDIVSYVHHHHAYIASGNDIVIVNLNSNPRHLTYEKINVGYPPLQIKVYEYISQLYLICYYEISNEDELRGYIKLYRKFSNVVWRQTGQPLLLTSPFFYDLDHITNVLILHADGYYENTFYAIVGYQWSLNVDDLILGTYVQWDVTDPGCDYVKYLDYNFHSKLIFIECNRATLLYNVSESEFVSGFLPTKRVIGKPYFNQNGRYGAIVHHDENETSTNITIVHLQFPFREVFELSTFKIEEAIFVDVNSTKRYFCYIGHKETGITCLDVLQSISTQTAVIKTLPNSHSLCSRDTCPSLKTYHNLLIVQNCPDEQDSDCVNGIRVYDLSTFHNAWNVTGVEPAFLWWRPTHEHTQTPPQSLTTSPDATSSASTLETHTSSESETTESALTTMDVQTTESTHSSLPTNPLSEATTIFSTHTTVKSSSSDSSLTLEYCQMQLETANSDYNRLLWITIGVTISFSVAILVAIVFVIAIFCVTQSGVKMTRKVEDKSQQGTKV